MRSVNMASGIGTVAVSWEGPGRPFAISGSSNMSLFVLGCGVTASLLDSGSGVAFGNCSVVCAGDEVMERLPDGLSVGIGCCRIDLVAHMRAFSLNISRTGEGKGRDKVNFLVTRKDGYAFRPSDLVLGIDANMVAPAMLDWAIPDQPSCERAMKDSASYACISSHSECQDSPIGGYVCHCSRGFSGNPYVVDGCVQNQVYGAARPKANCPTWCGNVSIPFPFGTEVGCFARLHLYLTCNPGSSPPILQMTEHSVVTEISMDDGVLHVRKLSDSGDFLADRDATFYAFSGEWGVVKWTVDNLTCWEAKTNKNEYKCFSAHSYCIDVTDDKTSRHVGYRCKCSSGFEGNPYIEDGCTDIDECLQPDKYICNGICQNTVGSFTCSRCPQGTDFNYITRKCKASSIVLGVTIGISSGVGLLLLIALVIVLVRRWGKGVQKQLRRRYFQKNRGILLEQLISSYQTARDCTKIFSLPEIEKATNNFEDARVVGRGGLGTVYKGIKRSAGGRHQEIQARGKQRDRPVHQRSGHPFADQPPERGEAPRMLP